MLARKNVDGPHVWHDRRTFPQAARKNPALLSQGCELSRAFVIVAAPL